MSGCNDCGGRVPVWFADNVIWNRVMGGPEARDDPGGCLCVHCFITRAERVLAPTAWRLVPEWLWREVPKAAETIRPEPTTPNPGAPEKGPRRKRNRGAS